MRRYKPRAEKDSISKKLEKMYQNYGINTSDMSDDEFDRIKESYLKEGKDLDDDLKKSEQFKERFENDIV